MAKEVEIKKIKATDPVTVLPGIGATSEEKLEKAGILDVISFASRTPNQISDIAGVSASIARKAIQFAKEELELGLVSLTKYVEKSEKPYFIKTGSNELDMLLGGGIRSGSINEAYAEQGTSKSQLGLTLTVNTCMRGEKVIYLDTEGAFRMERIKSIVKAKQEYYEDLWENGKEDKVPFKELYESYDKFLKEKFDILTLDEEKIIDNIFFSSVDNSSMQMMLMEDIDKLCSKDNKIKLLVIDSLTEHFRSEFLGRGELNTRQLQINKHMSDIKRICKTHNLAVYLTNQVMADPGAMFGDPIKPIGGNVYGHKCLGIDTIVLTKEGFKTLGNIKVGEYVWGKDKFVKVLNKSNIKEKRSIEIKSNNFIIASEEHRFPIMTDDGLFDMEVDNLEEGQFLISPNKIKMKTKAFKTNIKPKRLAKLNKKVATLIKESLRGNFKNNLTLEKKTNITIRQLRRVINELYPTDLENLKQLVKYSLDREISEKDYVLVNTHKHKNINIPEEINKDLIRLYGAWICDGSKTYKNHFTITKQQKSYLLVLQNLVNKNFGISGRIVKVKDKNAYRLIVSSKEIQDLFKSFNFDDVMLMSDDLVLEFVASLFDGDGSIAKKDVTFSQKNKEMITKLQMMLYRFGIKSTIQKVNKKKDCYSLYLLKYNRELIIDRLLNKEKIKYIKNQTISNQTNLHPIREIKEVGVKKVVDIEVEGHYFMANGIISHNCDYRLYLRRAKNNTRLAKLIKARDLPDGEAPFQVKDIGVCDL